VYSHVQVEGHSRFADHLRHELFCLAYGCGPLVWLTPQCQAVELDTHNDPLLALWLEQEARLYGLRLVETDFHTTAHSSTAPEGAKGGNHGRVAAD
jgi:hypothetical protein